jgi:tetrahydromethanopterin S-methyltransferase subunit E
MTRLELLRLLLTPDPPKDPKGRHHRRRLAAAVVSLSLFCAPAMAGELVHKLARPAALTPLQALFVGVQVGDLVSTRMALTSGHAREGNPAMTGMASSTPKLLVTKAALSVGTILFSSHLAKKNKAAALALLIVVDGVYAGAVLQNVHARRP